jgi:hypothetical protein
MGPPRPPTRVSAARRLDASRPGPAPPSAIPRLGVPVPHRGGESGGWQAQPSYRRSISTSRVLAAGRLGRVKR